MGVNSKIDSYFAQWPICFAFNALSKMGDVQLEYSVIVPDMSTYTN